MFDKEDQYLIELESLKLENEKLKTALVNISYVDPRPDLSLHKYQDALDLIHGYISKAIGCKVCGQAVNKYNPHKMNCRVINDNLRSTID